MRTALQIHNPFPLTPALSRRERENRSPSQSKTCDWIYGADVRKPRHGESLFPLPAGVGQGEGEASRVQP